MSTERQQSAIAEVRDQLSLDYADGEYLNVVSANLGLTRPPFGFSDDMWRAITKVLALQYKQIRQKFHDVLTIMFGPQVTQTATLAQSTATNVRQLVLNSSSHLPQTGVVILDEGLASEETIEYSFIDYASNTMYLNAPTTFAHTSFGDLDSEEPLVFSANAGDTTLYLPRSIYMPTTFPGTIVLGRGTEVEEVVAITANNTTTGTITVTALTNNHRGLRPSVVQTELFSDYIQTSEFLSLNSTAEFPSTGYVRLGASSNTITATAGTTTTVAFAVNSLSADRHVGSILVFTGNITPALAGVEAEVVSNTATGAVFREALPASPAAGDTFYVRPLVRYIRNVYTDNALQLARDIPDLTLPSGLEVELLDIEATASLGTIKVQGAGWDVIQVTPRLVEIYLPEEIRDVNNLLTASYLHPEILSVSTTTAAPSLVGDTTLTVTSTLGLPPAGGIVIDSGGANEELVGYSLVELSSRFVSAGSTTTTLVVADSIFTTAVVGQVVRIEDLGLGISLSREIVSNTPTSITFTDPVPNEIFSQLRESHTYLRYYDSGELRIPTTLTVPHAAAETVDYIELAYAGTNLPEGNLWTTDGVWPGPYVYDVVQNAPTPTVYASTLTQHTAGPTTVAVDQLSNNTALEVLNATSMPLGAVSPFQCVVGRDTGNREVITVQDVNLRKRTSTTVAANSLVGDTEIQVAALSGGGTADTFPNVRGYRVMIGRGTANEEIMWVDSTAVAPNRLVFSGAATNPHVIGESVELLADVLSVDPLDDNHIGFVPYTTRLLNEQPIGASSTTASLAAIGSSTLVVVSASDFPNTGKIRILQDEYLYSKSGNTLTLLNPVSTVRAYAPGTNVNVLRKQATPERVEVLYSELDVATTTGLPSTGGDVILNFGSSLVPVSTTGTTEIAGTTTITVADSSAFPLTYPYEIVIRPGHYSEERHLVTFNDGITELTLNGGSHGIVNALATGDVVQLIVGSQQLLTYTSVTPTTLRFSSPVVLNYSLPAGTPVIYTDGLSQPSPDGYNFPLRMPVDTTFRLEFLLDLIRAAGVRVDIIDKR